MITAQEARGLSGKTVEEWAEDFEPAIRKAAQDGKRKICHYHGELENEAYSNTDRWKAFVTYMESIGYKVSLYYMESQFVDMRINVSWES